MKRNLIIIILMIGFYQTAFGQSLAELIDSSIASSPELKMLNAKINAASNRIEQNTNLPDPMLSLGFMNLPTSTFSFNEEPMTMKVIGLSQEIPFPGLLGTKADVNRKDVEITAQEFSDTRNELTKRVAQSYYELLNIRKEIELTEQQIRLMKDISDVVKVMYSVSEASQQNLLRIDLELTNMAEMLSALNGEEAEQISTLNAYLLRNSSTTIVTDSFPQVVFADETVDELILSAKKNRPYLLGVNETVEKAKLSQSLAEYDLLPNVQIICTVWLSWRNRKHRDSSR